MGSAAVVGMSRPLTVADRAALAGITLLILASGSASFAESYRGLLAWAAHHGVPGGWSYIWPLMVDTFIAVGELALFVGLARRWQRRDRAAAWLVTALGVAVSVAGNVGHVTGHDWTARATGAVPPLAAAGALAVGAGVLKRVVSASPAAEREPVPVPFVMPTAAPAPVLVDPAAAATGSAGPVIRSRQSRHRGRGKGRTAQTRLTPAQQDAAVRAALQSDPGVSKAALARAVGISERSVGRSLQRLSSPAPGSA